MERVKTLLANHHIGSIATWNQLLMFHVAAFGVIFEALRKQTPGAN